MSSNVPASLQKRSPSEAKANAFLQSRETGEMTPQAAAQEGSLAQRSSPVAKSWAHFAAGA